MKSSLITNPGIRNIAIIAHVDHGKTTLVDQMFQQSGLFHARQSVEERIMDSMDLERERGITISAKNCSVSWGNTKINILDTPGHADFGGEVERALTMVDGAILLVDASEGPLPQTRFVLKKALDGNLKIIVVVNKIDRQDARPEEVLNEIYDLFIELGANDDQIEFPVLYAIGRDGLAKETLEEESKDLKPLFEAILREVPAPGYDPDEPFQMLVADLNYSEYLGRLAIGRVFHGTAKQSDPLVCFDENGKIHTLRANKLQVYEGVGITEVEKVEAGDILILAGIENVQIGDTICHHEKPKALPRISVDEPTVSMRFCSNTSPFAGEDGKFVQSTKIKERLHKETLSNVSLQVEEDEAGMFLVKGRGELQMTILLETMRREGFELGVGRPQVIYKEIDGETHEPIEKLYIDCEEQHMGVISEKLSRRKGRIIELINQGSGRIRVQFEIPSRGLIGYTSEFLTDTKGTGIMSSYLTGYEPYRGDFPTRSTGSLVSDRKGQVTGYALFGLEPRGVLFSIPGDRIYEGMIVGEHNRDTDLNVNACREKKLTNMRSSGKDDGIMLTPVPPMSLEKAIEFIRSDEMVEVTPKNIRLRKTHLAYADRHRLRNKKTTDK